MAKSKAGLTLEQAPREVAFCAYTILEPGALVVPGTPQDPRFAQNPLVTNGPLLWFYVGFPLISPEGYAWELSPSWDPGPLWLLQARASIQRTWIAVVTFLSRNSEAQVITGICPDCLISGAPKRS